MKKLLALALLLITTPAWAQNPTCPTRPPTDSSNACASTRFVHSLISTTSPRTKLAVATNFYVDFALGTDTASCGLVAGAAACKTTQYMTDQLLTSYDFGFVSVVVNIAANSANPPWQVTAPFVGAGGPSNVFYIGDATTPSNVVIDGGGGSYCIQSIGGAGFTIVGFKIKNCALGLSAPEQSSELYFANIIWDSMPAGSIGIYSSRQSYVEAVGGGNIINSIGGYFLEVSHQGNFRSGQLSTGNTAFTLGANVTCGGAFAYVSSLGDITFTGYGATGLSPFSSGGHTASCTQWVADSGGLIQALNIVSGQTLAPILFPGTVPGLCVGDCFIDQTAHSGTTVSSCGSGAVITGNDYYGTVTEGTSATGCNVAFRAVFTGAPYCTVTWNTAAPSTPAIGTSTVSLALTHGSASSLTFTYQCKGF